MWVISTVSFNFSLNNENNWIWMDSQFAPEPGLNTSLAVLWPKCCICVCSSDQVVRNEDVAHVGGSHPGLLCPAPVLVVLLMLLVLMKRRMFDVDKMADQLEVVNLKSMNSRHQQRWHTRHRALQSLMNTTKLHCRQHSRQWSSDAGATASWAIDFPVVVVVGHVQRLPNSASSLLGFQRPRWMLKLVKFQVAAVGCYHCCLVPMAGCYNLQSHASSNSHCRQHPREQISH